MNAESALVLDACALKQDLELFAAGDRTEVSTVRLSQWTIAELVPGRRGRTDSQVII